MSATYTSGYNTGAWKRLNPGYDARWDFLDASKAGTLAEFARGFSDGVANRPPNPKQPPGG